MSRFDWVLITLIVALLAAADGVQTCKRHDLEMRVIALEAARAVTDSAYIQIVYPDSAAMANWRALRLKHWIRDGYGSSTPNTP